MCPMAMGYYPLDRNICQLKLGSGIHPARRLEFHMNMRRSRHAFEDLKLRDLIFQSSPMCDEMELVQQHGLRGVLDTFKTAGLNIIMTRRSLAVILEYFLCTFILTVTAILSLTLPYSSSRATLVSSLILSSVFIQTTAAISTPQAHVRMHSILDMFDVCNFFREPSTSTWFSGIWSTILDSSPSPSFGFVLATCSSHTKKVEKHIPRISKGDF